jgi:hypothetical protein
MPGIHDQRVSTFVRSGTGAGCDRSFKYQRLIAPLGSLERTAFPALTFFDIARHKGLDKSKLP